MAWTDEARAAALEARRAKAVKRFKRKSNVPKRLQPSPALVKQRRLQASAQRRYKAAEKNLEASRAANRGYATPEATKRYNSRKMAASAHSERYQTGSAVGKARKLREWSKGEKRETASTPAAPQKRAAAKKTKATTRRGSSVRYKPGRMYVPGYGWGKRGF